MPLIIGSPLLDGELLDATVDLLRIQADDPAKDEARRTIMRIAEIFASDLKATKTMPGPGVAEARNTLKDLPDDTAALADRFRQASNSLAYGYGAATFSFADTDEIDQAKRQEMEALATTVRRGAAMLDEIASQLRPVVDHWAAKKTGELNIEGMAFGYPEKRLARAGGQLFFSHRPADFHAGKKGDFLQFVEYLYHLGAGHEPSGHIMLRPVREAVSGIKAAQTEQ